MAQQPMNNNPMANIMRMISQCGNNPQAYANQILQNNPNFAKAIQGQNPQYRIERYSPGLGYYSYTQWNEVRDKIITV